MEVGELDSEETWQQLKQVFNLHPLALEDIIHVAQRLPMEEYEDQLVIIIARMVSLRQGGKSFMTEQISLVVGKNYLLSAKKSLTTIACSSSGNSFNQVDHPFASQG